MLWFSPLETADHNLILLSPEYRSVVQRTEKVVKSIKQWTAQGTDALRVSFEWTT